MVSNIHDVVFNLNSVIENIISNYNSNHKSFSDLDFSNSLIKVYSNSELISQLIDCIKTLTYNDLDIGHYYYTKTESNLDAKLFIESELSLRKANENRSRMKNEIDNILLKLVGKTDKSDIRVTNIDSFSAYIDRLITERIKEYYFLNRDRKLEEAFHQKNVCEIIMIKISYLLYDIQLNNGYNFIGEKRTFDENKIIADVKNILKSYE